LQVSELRAVADELREFLVQTVSQMGGHFAAVLAPSADGSPALRVQHAARPARLGRRPPGVPHKVLTGRRGLLQTIKLRDGLAPFQPARSEYDTFGVGHSSTSISAHSALASRPRAPASIAASSQ
jgi:1-deoxy-D-xylulose-5-phosphate synthase